MPAELKAKIFISYCRHDADLVKPISELVELGNRDTVFFDASSLQPGDDWCEKIETAIHESTIFVLCWCCGSRASEFVAHEMNLALQKKERVLILYSTS